MRKLPEAPDRKGGNECVKRNPLGKTKRPVLF